MPRWGWACPPTISSKVPFSEDEWVDRKRCSHVREWAIDGYNKVKTLQNESPGCSHIRNILSF